MASLKIASLALKTLAKPVANQLKAQAKQHPAFRGATVGLAQFLHRREMNLRLNLLGEKGPSHIRPLNESKAIDSGAQFIAESFLFAVGAALILGESWRSRAKEEKRRDFVAESIEALQAEVREIREDMQTERLERAQVAEKESHLQGIMEQIVKIGLEGGWLKEGEGNVDLPALPAAPEQREASAPSNEGSS